MAQKLPGFNYSQAVRKELSAKYKNDDEYERAMFELLSAELQRYGKKTIVFIDNFGDMTRRLTDAEAHRLRKILQTSVDIRIFAASSVVLEAFYKYDHPFYEFFKIEELRGLTEKETRELLLNLSEYYKKEAVARIVEQNPGRIEALRRTTGGVIRTMILLFEIFADDEDGSAFRDLEIILDRTTPLYKHRMDDLSDQQQAIVEAIALNWDALNTKEISDRTRLESKVVSAQLQQLEKNGIIEKIPTNTKNHLYIVAERFFNIWFLMRLGRRDDEKRVVWLVRFFESWCDGADMKVRADSHRSALKKGRFDAEAALSYTQAMVGTKKLGIGDEHELLSATRAFLMENSPEHAGLLMQSHLEQSYDALKLWFGGKQEKSKKVWMDYFEKYLPKKEFDKLMVKLKKSSDWQGGMLKTANALGKEFKNLSEPEISIAENCWTWAAEAGHPNAMCSLGLLFEQKIDVEKAMYWYKKAGEAGNVRALCLIGLMFENQQDTTQALVWYEKAALAGYAGAMCLLGLHFEYKTKDSDKAIEWYEKAAEASNSIAMYRLGRLYLDNKMESEKGNQWIEKAAELGDIDALNHLSLGFYEHKTQKELAIKHVGSALKTSDNYRHRHTAACVLAWDNLIQESTELAIVFLKNEELLDTEPDDICTYFTLLIAKNQTQWLLDYFISQEGEAVRLKDRFKPIYYALLKRLDHPDFLRMGEELAQTVDEILAKADQMAVDYA